MYLTIWLLFSIDIIAINVPVEKAKFE